MLYLEDVKDEAQAMDVVGDLEVSAIEASEAISNNVIESLELNVTSNA